MRLDIDLDTELFERSGANRADGCDDGPVQAGSQRLLPSRLLRDREQIVSLRRTGKRDRVDFIALECVQKFDQRCGVRWQAPAISRDLALLRAVTLESLMQLPVGL